MRTGAGRKASATSGPVPMPWLMPRWGLLLALLLVCWPAAAADFAPVGIRLQAIKVSDHVYYVQGAPGVASATNKGFNSNAGFVVTRDGVVVIDALGTPALGAELIKAIRSVTSKPIRRVILTHYHADHFYGLQALKQAGAEVWAHHAGREYVTGLAALSRLEQRRRDLSPWVDARTRLVEADRWLQGDTAFALGGLHFEVIHLGPAHSPEDVIVTVREDGVIFSGDLIFTGRVPFVGEADTKRWLATIDRLMQMQPRLMVTGHGPVSHDPAQDLALTRDYLIYLRSEMGKAVADLVPFDEAYARTDWSRFAHLPAFAAANRVNAYGTYINLERESLSK